MVQEEIWKHLYFKGLTKEQRFEISNLGRVRRTHKKTGEWQYIRGHNSKGQIVFSFRSEKKGQQIIRPLHRLVAETFLEQPTKRHKFVVHKDFDKTNNAADNLVWLNLKDLTLFQKNNPNYKRGQAFNAKLTIEQVKEIKRALLDKDVVYADLGRQYNITQTQLNRIRKGESWKNVSIEDEAI